MNKIKIGEKEYDLRYSLRSLFIFEQITKKAFKIETLLDNYIFFYSMLLASNKDNPIDWDDFIDALDNDPALFGKMSEIVAAQQKKNGLFEDAAEESGDEKKS